ncbi:MAG: iron(III) transport system substrate-binding protein [Gaiellaceae bacterium]|jgi:iron(III) transport system substrate-binding protein|nr:iron(III) transport system substrate-binding protein [Gaiellaceae bacterium]
MHARVSNRLVALIATSAVIVAALAASAGNARTTKAPPPTPASFKSVLDQVKGMKLPARRAKLVELAKQEGGFTWYTTLSSTALGTVQKAWAARFPDVKMTVYRAASEDVTAKLLAEIRTGNGQADIVECNGPNMFIFQHKHNVLIPYGTSPYRAGIVPRYRFDTFTSNHADRFVVAWNKTLVPSPPRTFAELGTAKWKGKLAVEATDIDWFGAMYTYFTEVRKPRMTTKAADQLFKNVIANGQLVNGHTAAANLLAAGQIQVLVSSHAQPIEQLAARGAPVTFGPPIVAPVIERPQGLGIPYTMTHPAAALLFYDWMLSDEGQRLELDTGTIPTNPKFKDSAFSSNPAMVQIDLRTLVSRWGFWTQKFNSLIGQ